MGAERTRSSSSTRLRLVIRAVVTLAIVASLVAAAVACGGTAAMPPEDGSTAGSVAPETTEATPPDTSTTESVTPDTTEPPPSMESLLRGSWQSSCLDAGSGTYISITTVFDGAGHGSDTVVFYSDPGCTSATGLVKTNQTSYSLGASVIASGMSAYEIDITIDSWELKQDGVVVSSGTNVPTQYGIVAVEGDTLYTGGMSGADASPGMLPGDRPTTLDLANPYTRVSGA